MKISLYQKLIDNYNNTHWNTGIKTVIEWPYHTYIKLFDKFINYCDQKILFPLQSILQKYLYPKIMYHYGGDYRWNDQRSQNVQKETFNYGYGLIHQAIIKSQRPKNILCVGSMYGFIPYMMARACMENGKGHVYFIDAGYDINDPQDKDRHTFGQGFWKHVNTKQHFSYNMDSSYITPFIGTLETFLKKYPKLHFDYIYHDGDHTYKGGKRAVTSTWSRLNSEGYMALHDIHFEVITKGIVFGQWKVWDEIINKHHYTMEFTNHYSGVGIIQKNTKPRKRFKMNYDAQKIR